MSVYRIGEFQAKPETVEELRAFLTSIMPNILGAVGCESCQLFQSEEDAAKFIMIETWLSVQTHQASVKNIPAEKLNGIKPLLASAPRGSYYDLVASK